MGYEVREQSFIDDMFLIMKINVALQGHRISR